MALMNDMTGYIGGTPGFYDRPGPNSPFRNAPMPTGPDPRELPVWDDGRELPGGPAPRDGVGPAPGAIRGPRRPFPAGKVPAPPPTQSVAPPGTGAPGFTERPAGQFATPGVGEDNFYGGQQIAGSGPAQADYQSVQQYADAAFDESRRYLDPLQEQENRRLEQTLINKGVDPFSEQGQLMLDQLKRTQADANNSAAFQAMGFGQGIQDQMFNQEFQNQQLAGDMQKALWGTETARSAQELQKYLGDQSTGLGYAGLESQQGIAQMANELQRYLGDQDFALGQAGLDQQRYATDLAHQLGLSGQDLQRYGMDQDFALGQGGLDMQRYLGELQNQLGMAGLDLQRYGIDTDASLAQMANDLQRYGIDTGAQTQMAGYDLQRYLGDLQNSQFMGNLDLQRQAQDFSQMLGLEGIDFRNQAYNDSRGDYQDQMLLALLGMGPTPGGQMIDPSGAFGTTIGSAGSNKGLFGDLFG